MLSVFAEFEREILRERVKAGIAQGLAGAPPQRYIAHPGPVPGQLYDRRSSGLATPPRLCVEKPMVRSCGALRFSQKNAESHLSPRHMLLSVMGAFAQFERDLIRERQREGIALAKLRKGAYTGRKHSLMSRCTEFPESALWSRNTALKSRTSAKRCTQKPDQVD